jgi:hypothetical protein
MQLGRVANFCPCTAFGRRQNGFWKCTNTWSARKGDMADRTHLGSVEPVLCTMSFPCVILSVTMPYFGHNEDMHGFWSIWCFSIIRCSWTGRSTKLVELISNRHLSSISWMKCRFVGGKYMHFVTANTPHTLRVLLVLEQKKRIQSWGHKQELWCHNCSRIKNTTYNSFLGSVDVSKSWTIWCWKIGTTVSLYLGISACNHMVYLTFPFLKLYHSITHPPSHSFPLS